MIVKNHCFKKSLRKQKGQKSLMAYICMDCVGNLDPGPFNFCNPFISLRGKNKIPTYLIVSLHFKTLAAATAMRNNNIMLSASLSHSQSLSSKPVSLNHNSMFNPKVYCPPTHLRISTKDATFVPSEEVSLPAGLRRELLPNHVAVIMDGNRRWARMRGLPSGSGYEAGIRSLRVLVELCCKWGISVLTVFAFSSDNWFRPKVEVDFLMNMFETGMKAELENFMREDIRISVIGNPSKLPRSLQELIIDVEETTKHNSRLHLVVAVSYSGKYDIVQACQSIARKVQDGLINPEDINELLLDRELETNCSEFPYPDLLIRTSGELRVSNFFLWQLAYTELFFSKSHWPDFGEAEFLEALLSFQQRKRRFGGCNF